MTPEPEVLPHTRPVRSTGKHRLMPMSALALELDSPRLRVLLPSPPEPKAHPVRVLADLGGVAGLKRIRTELATLGMNVAPRSLRTRLRDNSVAFPGAGYVALPDIRIPTVESTVQQAVRVRGPLPVDDVIALVLRCYPHGDEATVRDWLRRADRLWVRRGHVQARL